MSQCPRCAHTPCYRLGDGRRKCRGCGHRYTSTSAWRSVRLLEAVKRLLLRQFVIGVPAYRLRHHDGASLKSRERFYRLARAACALAEGIDGALVAEVIAHARPAAPRAVEFTATVRGGRIVVLAGTPRAVPPRRVERVREGRPLEFVTRDQARITLPLRAERVVCAVPRHRPGHASPLVAFCDYALDWLRPYGAVRRAYFHLHVGEIVYRFNRRGQALERELGRLLRSWPIQRLRPLVRHG